MAEKFLRKKDGKALYCFTERLASRDDMIVCDKSGKELKHEPQEKVRKQVKQSPEVDSQKVDEPEQAEARILPEKPERVSDSEQKPAAKKKAPRKKAKPKTEE